MDHLASLCTCGHPRSESFDPANSDEYIASPLQCFACAAKDAEGRKASQAKASERFGDGAFDGLYIAVERRDGA